MDRNRNATSGKIKPHCHTFYKAFSMHDTSITILLLQYKYIHSLLFCIILGAMASTVSLVQFVSQFYRPYIPGWLENIIQNVYSRSRRVTQPHDDTTRSLFWFRAFKWYIICLYYMGYVMKSNTLTVLQLTQPSIFIHSTEDGSMNAVPRILYGQYLILGAF